MTEEIIRQFSIAARYGKQQEGGHLPRVGAAKAARACVAFDRLGPFGFVLYFLIIVGVIVALVQVTSRVADYAISSRAREASAATLPSNANSNEPTGPRVEGWSKRMDLKKPASIVDEIGHIILRSLRSEM